MGSVQGALQYCVRVVGRVLVWVYDVLLYVLQVWVISYVGRQVILMLLTNINTIKHAMHSNSKNSTASHPCQTPHP